MENIFGDRVMTFYNNLHPPQNLPSEIEWIMNIRQPETQRVMKLFYDKYYGDTERRYFWFGINPGRWGSGMTGIGFTDPLNLEIACGISNSFPKKHELSSQFIYTVLEEYGSVENFYKQHYFTAVCPLGLLKNNKNFNYYDDSEVFKEITQFVMTTLDSQIKGAAYSSAAVCIGQGKNNKILKEWNKTHQWFDQIITLPHPRWIMQYKRKNLGMYIDMYLTCIDDLCR
ncbi:uracil-DNA glycosylase family protein [Membranihabitans marinus]|uniref:uracil-DNA glycosylase family protein n=1 Tax=Membranihabitans marinus TaxID=1227546 RepID=UPI001F362577|nr:uracil-DNA glycosylase family protein [Membranihabitans marinus]